MPTSHELALSGWARVAKRLVSDDVGLAWAFAVASLLFFAINAVFAIRGVSPVLDGKLVETDDYLRLVRVEYLWQTGAWFDAVIPRVNPPIGLALHWTRPMDVLLMAGALLGAPLLGFKTALFWWGALISPLLQILAIAAVIWAVAPLLSRRWLPLVAFYFVAQPAVLSRFLVGRPDHHGLLILLLVLAIGFGLRVAQDPGRRSGAISAGLVGALAIWVNVESLVAVAMAVAAFGLCWLLGDRRFARALVAYSMGLCVGLAVALVVERGAGSLFVSEIDKISIPHIFMFVINWLLWLTLSVAQERGWLGEGHFRRTAWAAAGGAVALALLLLFFPQILADPMARGGELYLRKHQAHIGEIQPLVTWSALFGEHWAAAIGRASLWLGIALPAVPWVVYCCSVNQGAERRMWIFLALPALAFVPLTIYQIRWASYAEIVLMLPYAHLAASLAAQLASRVSERFVGILRPFVYAGLGIWMFIPGTIAGTSSGERISVAELRASCPISALAKYLNDPAGLGASPKKILAFIDFAPEILYRTPHAVLSLPNHRYQPGFAASFNIMSAEDFAVARQLLREQSVDLVTICTKSAERWFYNVDDGGRTLYQALSEDAPPSFLVPVPLPEEARAMKLFVFRPNA